MGTANAGVHRFIKPVNTWVHYTKVDGLSSNHVSWIAIQGNDVWFASKEDGVSRFDKVSGEWTIYKQADFLADNDVRAIARGADGKPLDGGQSPGFRFTLLKRAVGKSSLKKMDCRLRIPRQYLLAISSQQSAVSKRTLVAVITKSNIHNKTY